MKLHIALLASAMAFGLAACDSSTDADTQADAPAASESTAAPAPEATPAPAHDHGAAAPVETETTSEPAPVTEPAPTDEPAATAPADEAEAAATEAPAATEEAVIIGVAECDTFLTAIKNCINDTIPADQRPEQMKQIDEMVSMWKSLPASAVAPMCKQAHDVAKTTYANYGCSF